MHNPPEIIKYRSKKEGNTIGNFMPYQYDSAFATYLATHI